MCLFVWGVYRRLQYYSCTSASIVLWSWRAWSDPQRFPVFGWSLMNVAQCCWLLTTAGHLKRGRARQWTVKSRRRIGFLYWWKTPLNRKPTVSSVLFGRWLFLHGLNVDVFVMRFLSCWMAEEADRSCPLSYITVYLQMTWTSASSMSLTQTTV